MLRPSAVFAAENHVFVDKEATFLSRRMGTIFSTEEGSKIKFYHVT